MTWADVFGTCFYDQDGHVKSTRNKGGSKRKPIPAAGKNMAKHRSLQTRLSFSDISNAESAHFAKDLSNSLGPNVCVFTTNELRSITNNFSLSHLLGEGGFGPVYKGFVDEKLRPEVLKPQTVAVKLLDLEGHQGHNEWLAEVIYLGQLKHPHVVKLIGYCCEEEQRLLVYEFMARGSLENHLFKRFSTSLPWEARLKMAVGAAKGLAFLHGLDQPIIYRDFKPSNILLDSDFTAKLSDFGLAKDGPEGEETHLSTRVMGTHGYAAPEYVMTGHLTAKSDVYSFGVVFLELLTGLRSMDKKRPGRRQNLVEWTRPYLNDSRKLNRIMDPSLEGQYSLKGAQKAAALAFQCLARHPKSRPDMSEVVEILEPLQQLQDIANAHFVYTAATENGKVEQQERKPAAKESRHSQHSRNGLHGHRNRSPISVMPTKSWSSHSDGSPSGISPSPRHKSREGK